MKEPRVGLIEALGVLPLSKSMPEARLAIGGDTSPRASTGQLWGTASRSIGRSTRGSPAWTFRSRSRTTKASSSRTDAFHGRAHFFKIERFLQATALPSLHAFSSSVTARVVSCVTALPS